MSSGFSDVRLLGEGAQARVFLVEHDETGERHCVKRVTMSTKKAAEQALLEVNVLGDTMRLGSPSAANKVQNDPAMQETLLEMKRQMDALLGTVGVSTADC